MNIFLVPNTQKQQAIAVAKQAAALLLKWGASLWMENAFASLMGNSAVVFCGEEEALTQCDVIVTVGGDGTILRMARRSLAYNRPILGINVGRLGFLATVEADELEKLKCIVTGEYHLDCRNTLAVRVSGQPQEAHMALNEVVIAKACVSQTMDIEIYCDDTLVYSYQGDGVIVATPTGSTAYSLSAGGPVLDARIAGLVVTPICAHSMHSPPMVFSAERKLRICANPPQDSKVFYSCDGLPETALERGETVEAALSDQCMTLISLHEADQFDAIDKKLKGR